MAKEGEEQEQEPQPDVAPSSERVTIDLADVDDDEEGGEKGAAAAQTPESRKGRRTQFREVKEGKKRAEDRAESLERQMAELRGQMTSMRQQPVYLPAQQQQQDPAEAEIDSLWQQQQLLLRSIQSPNAGQADVDAATEQWRKLERQRRTLEVRQAVGQMPQQDGASEQRVVNQMLTAEFPEVFNSYAHRTRAQAEMADLMAQGKPQSIATAREACERVAERYGLRKTKAPAPTDNQKARYTGVPSRAGVASSASGQYTPTTNVLRTARAYTKHLNDLTDEDRVRKWVREVGKPNGLV